MKPPEGEPFVIVPLASLQAAAKMGAVAVSVLCAVCSHTNGDNECWPTHAKLTERSGASRRSVLRAVRLLENAGLIVVKRNREGKAATQPNRYVVLPPPACDREAQPLVPESHNPCDRESQPLVPESHNPCDRESHKQETRTTDKKTRAKEQEGRTHAARFKPPTVEEVATYCQERDNGVDAQHFVDYYETRGWKLNRGTPMKDWRAAVRTWERNGFANSNGNGKAGSEGMSDKERRGLVATQEWLRGTA